MKTQIFYITQIHLYKPFEVTTFESDPCIISTGFKIREHADLTCALFNEITNGGRTSIGPVDTWTPKPTLWNEFVKILAERGKTV